MLHFQTKFALVGLFIAFWGVGRLYIELKLKRGYMQYVNRRKAYQKRYRKEKVLMSKNLYRLSTKTIFVGMAIVFTTLVLAGSPPDYSIWQSIFAALLALIVPFSGCFIGTYINRVWTYRKLSIYLYERKPSVELLDF